MKFRAKTAIFLAVYRRIQLLKDLNLLDVVALICFSLEVLMIFLSNPFLL